MSISKTSLTYVARRTPSYGTFLVLLTGKIWEPSPYITAKMRPPRAQHRVPDPIFIGLLPAPVLGGNSLPNLICHNEFRSPVPGSKS